MPSLILGTEVREVGARVRGQLYALPLSPQFVVSESVEIEEGAAERAS